MSPAFCNPVPLLRACHTLTAVLQAPEPGSSEEYSDAAARLEWVDELVRHLNGTPCGRDGLLLSVVLGSGGAALPGALLRPGSAQAHSDAQSRYSLPTTAGVRLKNAHACEHKSDHMRIPGPKWQH